MNDTTVEKEKKDFFAAFNLYTHMAHYVANVLKQRPNDILDGWGVAELLVAYGQYTNEKVYSNFLDWKGASREARSKMERPEEYHVKFYSPEDLEEGGEAGGD